MTWTSHCVVCAHMTESLCGDNALPICTTCSRTMTVELHCGGRTVGVICGVAVSTFLGHGKFPVRVVHRIKLQELDGGGKRVTVVE